MAFTVVWFIYIPPRSYQGSWFIKEFHLDTLDNFFQLTQNHFKKITRLAAVLPASTKEEPYGTQKKNSKRSWSVVESIVVGCL